MRKDLVLLIENNIKNLSNESLDALAALFLDSWQRYDGVLAPNWYVPFEDGMLLYNGSVFPYSDTIMYSFRLIKLINELGWNCDLTVNELEEICVCLNSNDCSVPIMFVGTKPAKDLSFFDYETELSLNITRACVTAGILSYSKKLEVMV